MSSDLPYAIASWSYASRKIVVLGPAPTDRVTIAAEKQAKLGFPTAAGDRRRLGVDGQGIADVILWRQFRSGPVIVVVEVERGLGASCFVPCLLGRAKRARAAQSEKERPMS